MLKQWISLAGNPIENLKFSAPDGGGWNKYDLEQELTATRENVHLSKDIMQLETTQNMQGRNAVEQTVELRQSIRGLT